MASFCISLEYPLACVPVLITRLYGVLNVFALRGLLTYQNPAEAQGIVVYLD